MNREEIEYTCGTTTCRGYYVYNEIVQELRPGILLAHAWRGQDDFIREQADELARLGFVAFAIDYYGNGKSVQSNSEAEALMLPLFLNRQLLRDRVCAGFDALKQQKYVDTKKIGALGYCFGGLAVIELLRSGVDVNAVVSFHGLLGDTLGDQRANSITHGDTIKGALMLLHGHQDPMVSNSDINAIQKEFTDAGVDWQMHIYGHAFHAFTVPDANDVAAGTLYNEKAATRSWKAMRTFFEEHLT